MVSVPEGVPLTLSDSSAVASPALCDTALINTFFAVPAFFRNVRAKEESVSAEAVFEYTFSLKTTVTDTLFAERVPLSITGAVWSMVISDALCPPVVELPALSVSIARVRTF